ncbi:hypothetical protein ACFLYA_00310 [Candidatus Dependentiae bacterium]
MNTKGNVLLFSLFISFLSYCNDDVINVALFFDTYDCDGLSTEVERFKEYKRPGPVVLDLIIALNQKVDVIVASAPLIHVLRRFSDPNVKNRFKKAIKKYENEKKEFLQEKKRLIQKWKHEIEKRKQNENKNSKERQELKIIIGEHAIQRARIKELEQEMQELKKISAYDIDFSDENLSAYKTDDAAFAVFVNKKKKKGNKLFDYGLNENLQEVDKPNLYEAFETVQYGDINMDSLKSIFVGNKKKIVCLNGHGAFAYEKKISMLKINQFVDFVDQFLPKIDCIFLSVATCFGAGAHIERFLKKVAINQNRSYKEVAIPFPIVLFAISDIPTFQFLGTDNNKFFNGLHALLSPRSDLKDCFSVQNFEPIMKHLSGPYVENTSLIRLAGKNRFFRPVSLADSMEIMTRLRGYCAKEIGKQRVSSIELRNEEKIFLYTTALYATIKIVGGKAPFLISMVPGDSCHFINRIEAKDISLNALLIDMLGSLEIRSKKLFLINHILCRNFKNSGLLFPQNPSKNSISNLLHIKNAIMLTSYNFVKKLFAVDLLCTINGKKKYCLYNANTNRFASADYNYSRDDMNDFLRGIQPSEHAYIEATGGLEDKTTFMKAAEKHFALKS